MLAPAAARAVSKEKAQILPKGPLGAELYNRQTSKILRSQLSMLLVRWLSSMICSMLSIAFRVCKENSGLWKSFRGRSHHQEIAVNLSGYQGRTTTHPHTGAAEPQSRCAQTGLQAHGVAGSRRSEGQQGQEPASQGSFLTSRLKESREQPRSLKFSSYTWYVHGRRGKCSRPSLGEGRR